MKVSFQVFKSHMKSWTDLCQEAAAFASEKGKERLINVSVSADSGQGTIVRLVLGLRRTCDVSPCLRS
jgi:hypothetical protein